MNRDFREHRPPVKMCCQSSGQGKSSAQSSSSGQQPREPSAKSSSSSVSSPATTAKATAYSRLRHIPGPILVLILLGLIQIQIQVVAAGLGQSLHGWRISCSNEGEEVKLDQFNCYNCECKNGFVNCRNTCPPIDDCYIQEKPENSCCSKCKGCIFRGVPYESGAEWSDPEDPCRTYKCMATVVTETVQKCYSQCDDNQLQPPRPGECCPTCQGCKINGQTVAEGQEVDASIDDRCLVCQCSSNQLTCSKKTCPVLPCPMSKQIKRPDECCPRCAQHQGFMSVPGKCFFNNKVYPEKTQFMPDRCTNCTCLNSTAMCQRATCPILECAPEFQEFQDGSCCPRCAVAEVRSECSVKGVTYQNNETWDMGPCRSCRCNGGTIRCSQMRCPPVKCRANEELKLPPGECCQRCVETAGTCTVFGDPHFRTFDGKFFSFQGSCKYLLAKDCLGHTFEIRLTNEGRGTRHASWAKTVTLKLHNLRVNLGQKLRIKVNGTRVLLPYIGTAGGRNVTIERLSDGGAVMLRSEMGLSLEWDGGGFLQVSVPAKFKKRLCGLCGNFNGSARDDLTGKDGRNHVDEEVWHFANSWRVGGPKSCSRKREILAAVPTCDKRKSSFYCHPLSVSPLFGECNERLNPENYIAACRMDVCECPSGACHCDSFAAYAHECRRLGVQLPDWRTATNCKAGWRRNATLSNFLRNEFYGDSSFRRGRKRKNHQLQLQQQKLSRHHRLGTSHNQLEKPGQASNPKDRERQRDEDFIAKHVPSGLLFPRAPDRTPPPLH